MLTNKQGEKIIEICIIISVLCLLTTGGLYIVHQNDLKKSPCEICSELNPNLSICIGLDYNEIPSFNFTTNN